MRQLLDEDDNYVINLDKLTYASNVDSLPIHERHKLVQGDICDNGLVDHLLQSHKPHAIVHLAAESHVDRSIDTPAEFVTTNVQGTTTLLEAARHHWSRLSLVEKLRFRYLQVSTDEVYGSTGSSGRFTEATPLLPNSPYAASKAAADMFVRAYHRTYGFPAMITRCSNNYGPHQHPEKLIPLTILNAFQRRPIPVYGDGTNVRDWIFVEDHCYALQAVLDKGTLGETYNIGGGNELSNNDVVSRICKIIDLLQPDGQTGSRTELIAHVQDRPGHDKRYAVDAERVRSQLGWLPKTDFDSGLEQTIQWYLRNAAVLAKNEHARQRRGLSYGD